MTAVSSLEVAIPAAKQAGIPQDRIILLEGKKEGFYTIHDLISFGKSVGLANQVPSLKIRRGESNKDLCGFLSFSSGTTGLPKAVSIDLSIAWFLLMEPGHDLSSQCHRAVLAGNSGHAC